MVLEILQYTFEEFREIAISRLTKEKVDKSNASVIAENVWNKLDSRDIRDVMKVGLLANTIQEVSFIVNMMKRGQDIKNENIKNFTI